MKILRLMFLALLLLLPACSGVEMYPAPVQTRPAEITPFAPASPAKHTSAAVAPREDATVSDEMPAATLPAGQPPSLDFAPSEKDAELERSPVFIDTAEILTLESAPPQFMLHMAGNLPTPCHRLRVKFEPPDAKGVIVASAYTVANQNLICAQMLQPFEVSVPIGPLPTGQYSLTLDGEKIGSLMVP